MMSDGQHSLTCECPPVVQQLLNLEVTPEIKVKDNVEVLNTEI